MTRPLPVLDTRTFFDRGAEGTHALPAQPLSFPPGTTRQLLFRQSPNITRSLTDSLTQNEDGSIKRPPLVIKGQRRQKSDALSLPAPLVPQRQRRRYIMIAAILTLFLVTCITLFTVTPLGHDLANQNVSSALQSNSVSLVNNNNSNPNLSAPATATAIFNQQTDGYDPYYTGSQTFTDGSSDIGWPYGQCTYWANYHYHQLTGHWISWSGNADLWADGARAAGWSVSTTPHLPSIIVLLPYVQGAGGYGHVAVVEKINTPTNTSDPVTVMTSNMNWWANGGGLGIVSDVDFTVGQGVFFIWHD